MKTLLLLSLSLAVALGRPPFDSRVAPKPVLTGENQSPLLRDWVPVQGHVVVEDPATQVRLNFREKQEKTAPVNLNPEVKAELKADVKPDVEMEPELSNKPDFKVESEVKVGPDVQEAESEEHFEMGGEPIMQQKPLDDDNVSEANQDRDNQRLPEEEEKGLIRERSYVLDGEPTSEVENQSGEVLPELSNNPDFKVESEVKVETDVQEAETEERHIDMEGKYEMAGEPIMEMEPLDDDDLSEEELSNTRMAFQHQEPVNQRLSEEEEKGLIRERSYVLDGEPTSEVENQPGEVLPELSNNPDFKVESEVKVETDVQEAETEERHIDMEGKYEMAGEPIMEMEPLDDDDLSEEELSNTRMAFQHQEPVNQRLSEEEGLMRERTYVLDGEPIKETDVQEAEAKERHIDMERRYDIVGEPIMELEPLDDDISKEELSEMELLEVEKSLRSAFQNQNPVNQHLSEEEEGLIKERTYVLDEEPVLELEPLEIKAQENLEEETESSQETEERHIDMESRYEIVGETIMELEPLDDDNMHGKKMSSKEWSDVNMERNLEMVGEPIMELEPLENTDTVQKEEERSLKSPVQDQSPDMHPVEEPGLLWSEMDYDLDEKENFPNEEAREGSPIVEGSEYKMMDEPASEFVEKLQMSPMALSEEPADSPVINQQGRSCYPGVMLEGKCYQFFKEPKRAADAEFFCQEHFSGGHLASITSPHIHRGVMNLILQQNGALTRTWVGGLRNVETDRFIWLDGSHWGFADWLSGEPNHTSDKEHCVEVLPQGNGKFNDFTCWEPQAFICSFSY
ncbi:trichohyalin-like isoform X2 [Eleginops maclovinus]|uniref:trichohyalin-like isoform X2 n=1 Tax=Eleginops maclovinus TaxID=56733 RepID=UPI0030801B1E